MTLGCIYLQSTEILSKISSCAKLDAQLIISHVCGFTPSEFVLKAKCEISEDQCEKIKSLVRERSLGIPVAYVTGTKAFYRDIFFTDSNVLIPQNDTETLVELAVKSSRNLKSKSLDVLDLCAGTGCIGISFANEISPMFNRINLYLSDISKHAYSCFSRNVQLVHGENVKTFLCQGNLFEPVENIGFDFILTNPPYIRTDVIPTLDSEVQAEPHLALDGGPDGLTLIRKIVEKSPAYIKKGGYLIMETGYDQGNDVAMLFRQSGFENVEITKDLAGLDRVVSGRRNF